MQAQAVFRLQHQESAGSARTGELTINNKRVLTPNVVQTGTITESLTPQEILQCQTQVLKQPVLPWWLRHGDQVAEVGDLHQLLKWPGLIVTTSGATEVYHWAKPRGHKKDGVSFHDPQTGQLRFYTPAIALQLQQQLGGDLIQDFAQMTDYFAPVDDLNAAVKQTALWQAKYSLPYNGLITVIGGGLKRARQASVNSTKKWENLGFSIAGITPSVPVKEQQRILRETVAMLPELNLRYLPTVGTLTQLAVAIACGIDLIDSDLATRQASMGNALVGKEILHLDRDHFALDHHLLLEQCQCPTCRAGISRATIHHLLQEKATELGKRYLLLHNLYTINQLLQEIRQAINNDNFTNYYKELLN